MRVLHVIAAATLLVAPADTYGGAERILATAARALAARPDWDVEIATIGARTGTAFIADNCGAAAMTYGSGGGGLGAEWRLAPRLAGRAFDLVVSSHVRVNAALATARARLGGRASGVQWIVADVTKWQPTQAWDVWHDRAAFHFLTGAQDQAAYAGRVRQAVRPGGNVIIGTFSPDGPERCSGLPVVRHDAASIGAVLGPAFTLVESRRHDHRTPGTAIQRFQFSRFQRVSE